MATVYDVASAEKEYVFDDNRTCKRCGSAYNVVFRVYTQSLHSSTRGVVFGAGSPEESRKRVNSEMQRKEALVLAGARTLRYPHRCTKCGQYDDADIKYLQSWFPVWRRSRALQLTWELPGVCFMAAMVVLLPILTFCVLISPNTEQQVVNLLGCAGVAAGVLAAIYYGWRVWPSQKNYAAKISGLNAPRIVYKWLDCWSRADTQEKLAHLLADLEDCARQLARPGPFSRDPGWIQLLISTATSSRADDWEKLYRIQRKFDPFIPRSAGSHLGRVPKVSSFANPWPIFVE
jgi:hypothetical protein